MSSLQAKEPTDHSITGMRIINISSEILQRRMEVALLNKFALPVTSRPLLHDCKSSVSLVSSLRCFPASGNERASGYK